MDLKKNREQKQGHFYSKREEAAWSFLFLYNNDPDFCTLLLGKKQGTWFFEVQDPKKILGWADKLDIRVQIDWAIVFIIGSLKYM